MSDRKYLFFNHIDNQGNNLLHKCGKLAPPGRLNLVAGPALQMQRELQWFKEIEKFVRPSRRTWYNYANETPQMLFTKEHEKLKADGERWMKDTANACTIAAALIATVVFAAAFTVPAGIESASGKPLLSDNASFVLFAVSDAISLFTSITSLLMFLSILTSRYAEEDFLYVLPKRLSMGLLSLFVSNIYLVLQRDVAWFVVLVAAFACLPVASFVLLQFPLLADVIYSTYCPGIFGKKTNRLLY
ncbi:ankyrin repeat-containing protein NPR4-like [Salvia splendens]|uniref:ankyrin repeat-containing protein NPR4-like n=1 Tax=Salvia splendens TaxID=180675 RepID=UPI001C258A1D|nr:ankyrin repeat-containing protein NPR4-like [Salvia splendens]